MLHELRIENLLLIERAELRFGAGLNAITGETGAGKTVLAHSLDLLMGGRARPQIVRPGAGEAWVEGVFALPEGLLDDPELAELAARLPAQAQELTLGRRVSASGRTSAFVAGRSASAGELRALGSRLLSFYGQHEHRRLAIASAQLEIVDGFAGGEHRERRERHRQLHATLAAMRVELAELREREGARERDLDLLRFELAEIEAASPDPSEHEELVGERERLRHGEGLRAGGAQALAALAGEAEEGGAVAALALADASVGNLRGVDTRLDPLADRVAAATLELADLASELRAYLDGLDADPGRLEAVEERLAVLERLVRKHGGSIEAVLEHGASCRARIEELTDAEGAAAEIEARVAELEAERARVAGQLTATRRQAAGALAERVAGELAELAMDGARLEIELAPHPRGAGPNGEETVEIRIATNPGMPVSALRDAASGGELSRIMLALAGLAGEDGPRTLVFDEIDAGVGGTTARAVGERLRALGRRRQVICITHLPQVASLAETHFRIEKSAGGGEARAEVERVGGEELVAEIVRMLGAARGDRSADRHARELLRAA